ncbi:MAG: hypothetical protein ACK4ZU_11525 [Allorhizobium sp.]
MKEVVTAEDLRLLSTPDAEIIEKSQQEWSFDCDECRSRIKDGERWQHLLLAHIYLEHVMAQILKDAIPFPDEISFSRMPFSQRLDLARALDLLPPDLVSAIRRITKMRNQVAHSLSFSIGDSEVKDLENCSPQGLRTAIEEDVSRTSHKIELFELLEAVVIMTEIFRQRHLSQRLLARKAQIRLRTVLDKTPGARYVE